MISFRGFAMIATILLYISMAEGIKCVLQSKNTPWNIKCSNGFEYTIAGRRNITRTESRLKYVITTSAPASMVLCVKFSGKEDFKNRNCRSNGKLRKLLRGKFKFIRETSTRVYDFFLRIKTDEGAVIQTKWAFKNPPAQE